MKFDELLDRLHEFDLLLDADAKFPSVTGFVAGDDVRGSWWTHPQSHEMYSLACRLHEHPDVLLVKLISGKVTLVRRPLWPAVFAVATAREPWQLEGLSKDAKALLKEVDKETRLSSSGDPVRELETRLLVYSESVHTERGFHTKELQTWKSWAKRANFSGTELSPSAAKAQLEAVVAHLNRQFNAAGKLPWNKKRRPRF
ncbi:MAG TPA: hypothetical protein VIX89_02685 [Bryobacteraceae bacterium]